MGVTLKDVAKRAGVNVSTASRALSPDKNSLVKPETRLRVREAAEALKYSGNAQASALRRGRTGMIGVIVSDLSNPFIGPVLRGIASALANRDLLPIMVESGDASDKLRSILDKLAGQRVDGMITTAARYRDRALLRRVASGVPTVLAVRDLPGSGIPAIVHDDVSGGRLAAEHLLALGHNCMAQLMGPADIWSFEGRASGFRDTLTASGATCIDIRESARLPTVEAGSSLALALLEQTGVTPTAVFAHNDSMAIGAIRAFRDRGLDCPADISVVGYNDVPLTDHLHPPLTTIRLPGYELGRLAAELLVTRIDETEATTEKVVLAPEIVVRATTARPAA